MSLFTIIHQLHFIGWRVPLFLTYFLSLTFLQFTLFTYFNKIFLPGDWKHRSSQLHPPDSNSLLSRHIIVNLCSKIQFG